MSFLHLQKKIMKKKLEFGRIRIPNRIWIRYPGSGSADPDPDLHQDEADPKHLV